MRKQFQKIPSVLQKQIMVRLAGSGLGIVMLILILAYQGSIQFLLPGIAITFIFLASAFLLFYRCSEGKYVVIRGTCEEIERTGLRKRLKAVYIQCDEKSVKIVGLLLRLRNLRIGDILEVYIADSTPVYEHDGVYVITNTLAVSKGNRERK